MFKINIEHKIGLDGFVEQDLPFQCPECNTELTVKNTIGFGEYPKGGWRSRMKPNQTIGQGFECPKCFAKSCFHADEFSYQLYIDYKQQNKLETHFQPHLDSNKTNESPEQETPSEDLKSLLPKDVIALLKRVRFTFSGYPQETIGKDISERADNLLNKYGIS